MSNFLKEKYTLAKLSKGLEGRRGKLYRSCKGFGHLAHNCRNKEGKEKGKAIPQNKFKMLTSRVIRCGLEERMIRRQEEVRRVECFKCGEKGHKCKECLLWKKEKKREVEKVMAHIARPQKV